LDYSTCSPVNLAYSYFSLFFYFSISSGDSSYRVRGIYVCLKTLSFRSSSADMNSFTFENSSVKAWFSSYIVMSVTKSNVYYVFKTWRPFFL